jgi:hypothetical protein
LPSRCERQVGGSLKPSNTEGPIPERKRKMLGFLLTDTKILIQNMHQPLTKGLAMHEEPNGQYIVEIGENKALHFYFERGKEKGDRTVKAENIETDYGLWGHDEQGEINVVCEWMDCSRGR